MKCLHISKVAECRFRSGEDCTREPRYVCISCKACRMVMIYEEWERRGAVQVIEYDYDDEADAEYVSYQAFYCSEACRDTLENPPGEILIDVDGRFKVRGELFRPDVGG